MNVCSLLNPSFVWQKRHSVLPRIRRGALQSLRHLGVPTSSSDREIRKLRGIHAGRRGFILGNGPSLQIVDINKLSDEISFASNKIYLCFDQTDWRPNYYVVADRLVAKNNAAVIQSLPITKIISDDFRGFFPPESDIVWFNELWRNHVILDRLDGRSNQLGGYFSTDALVGLDAGSTVVYSQLQLAYYMGIREVYIIGLDFSFSVPLKTVETRESGYEKALESAGEVNHFHPDYRKPGEIWAIPRLDCQQVVFELAKRQFESVGGKVYNASRQSKLDVFERIDFDSLFPS
jgi:hypothetical protein